MGVDLGRVSGPLLSDNLLRNGNDLAFETSLLYLNVVDGRIGIRSDAPVRDLFINSYTLTTNLVVDTQAELADFTLYDNHIQNLTGSIYIRPDQTDPTVRLIELQTSDLSFTAELINNLTTNSNIEITANGDGTVQFYTTTVNVDGTIHSTGNITADGSIIFGNSNTDSVDFNSDLASTINPDITNTYDLGSPTVLWNNLYSHDVNSSIVTLNELVVSGIDLTLRPGNTIYVSVNGDDNFMSGSLTEPNDGTHPHSPFKTIEKALSVAAAGDEVVIFPGEYEENFPLTVPQGVSIRGAGIRAVTVMPTIGTRYNDAFLLNGETTVSFLTVRDFLYDSLNDTGYAFKFANNFVITTRSPYIYYVSVITKGSTITLSDPLGYDAGDAGRGALFDGSVASSTSTGAYGLVYNTTFITPGQVSCVATNGAKLELINSFTYFASTGINLITGTAGFASEGITRVTITGVTGIVNVGDDFTYYSADGSTVLASGEVIAVDGDVYSFDGYVNGLELITDIPPNYFAAISNASITTSNYKFSTGSLDLAGTNYISNSDNFKYSLTDVDFCVEGWIYPTAFPTTETVIAAHWGITSAEQAFKLVLTSFGGITIYLNDGLSFNLTTGIEYLLTESGDIIVDESDNPIVSENTAVVLNSWQHIAVSRSVDTVRIFINGKEKVSSTLLTNAVINNSNGIFTIGYSADSTEYFTGQIDEFRLSKNISRYASDFIVSTIPYTADVNTFLLLHFNDEAASTQFIDSSTIIQNLQFTNAIATAITNLDYKDFAAEVRSVNCTSSYGMYGVVANGFNALGYLTNYTFSYIGTGKNSDNVRPLSLSENEIVELNSGTIYFDSINESGEFNVDNSLTVNQQTGITTITVENFELTGTSKFVFENDIGILSLSATDILTSNIRTNGNNIDSMQGDVNFETALNYITLNTNVYVTGSVDITANTVINGTLYLGNEPTDLINIAPLLTETIDPKLNNAYDLGEKGLSPHVWDVAYLKKLDIDGSVYVENNTISTVTANTTLRLIAAGSGKVHIIDTNVQINERLFVAQTTTVDGLTSLKNTSINGNTIIVGDINQTGDTDITGTFTSHNIEILDSLSYFDVPDIRIVENNVQITATDTSLTFIANGTGSVKVEYLKISNTSITNSWVGATSDSEKSIILSPNGVGTVDINTTTSIIIPYADDVDRILYSNGELRQNNSTHLYEAYVSTGLVSLNNLYDSDRNTYITAELTPGANDHVLRFANNGVVYTTITETELTNNVVHAGNVKFTNNYISNADTATDLSIQGDTVNINDVYVQTNSINNTSDSALILESTNDGYYKFSGSAGVVIPTGPSTDRRLDPELGEVRHNTTLGYMEVFDGTDWIPAIGTETTISAATVEEIMDEWTLILG